MPILASDVMDRAASFLNDTDKNLYTYTVQLPYLKESNDQLSKAAVISGLPVNKKQAATITLASGATVYTPLPNDIVVPVDVWERNTGSSDDWSPMDRLDFTPGQVTQGAFLNFWWWSNQAVNFIGATQSREVRLDYIRLLTSISSSSSPEEVEGCTSFLAWKTAELCALMIGQDKEMALLFNGHAKEAKDDLIRIAVKNNQGVRSRRKSYRLTRRHTIISG